MEGNIQKHLSGDLQFCFIVVATDIKISWLFPDKNSISDTIEIQNVKSASGL